MQAEGVHDFLHMAIDRDVLKARAWIISDMLRFVTDKMWERNGQRGGGHDKLVAATMFEHAVHRAISSKLLNHQHVPALVKHLKDANSAARTMEFIMLAWSHAGQYEVHEDELIGTPEIPSLKYHELAHFQAVYGEPPSRNMELLTHDVAGAFYNATHSLQLARVRLRTIDAIISLLSNYSGDSWLSKELNDSAVGVRQLLRRTIKLRLLDVASFGLVLDGDLLKQAQTIIYNCRFRPIKGLGRTLIDHLELEHIMPGSWASSTENSLIADIDVKFNR